VPLLYNRRTALPSESDGCLLSDRPCVRERRRIHECRAQQDVGRCRSHDGSLKQICESCACRRQRPRGRRGRIQHRVPLLRFRIAPLQPLVAGRRQVGCGLGDRVDAAEAERRGAQGLQGHSGSDWHYGDRHCASISCFLCPARLSLVADWIVDSRSTLPVCASSSTT
jgi:hypothetical protein